MVLLTKSLIKLKGVFGGIAKETHIRMWIWQKMMKQIDLLIK